MAACWWYLSALVVSFRFCVPFRWPCIGASLAVISRILIVSWQNLMTYSYVTHPYVTHPYVTHPTFSGWHPTFSLVQSMGWLKGKSTGNHRFSHEILDVPVFFPLNQSTDSSPPNWITAGGRCAVHTDPGDLAELWAATWISMGDLGFTQ